MAKYDVGVAMHGKRCQKCGGEPIIWTDTGTTDFIVQCGKCGDSTDWFEDSVFSAVVAWNRGERDYSPDAGA